MRWWQCSRRGRRTKLPSRPASCRNSPSSVEQQKFDVGVSTNYLVIQFQTFLAQARSTELAAKGAYAKARIALERALGRTLDVNHVSLTEAYRGQVSRSPQSIPGR